MHPRVGFPAFFKKTQHRPAEEEASKKAREVLLNFLCGLGFWSSFTDA